MTQNTTKNNKQESCDTKHNALLKTFLAGENIFRILLLQPTRQQVECPRKAQICERFGELVSIIVSRLANSL